MTATEVRTTKGRPLPKRLWLWAGAWFDGVGSGVVGATVPILTAQRFGLLAAGAAVGIGAAGRLGGLGLARWVELRIKSALGLQRAFSAFTAALVVASLALLSAAWLGPYWVIPVLGLLFSVANNITTTILREQGRSELMHLGPIGMTGSAAGAVLASCALSVGGAIAVTLITGGLCVQALQVPLLRRFGVTAPSHRPVALRALRVPFARALVLAACCYGPVSVYAVLVREVETVAWVGPSMVAFAAGGLLAPWVDVRLNGFRQWPSMLALGAVGIGVWAVATSGPLIVAGRVLSGVTLFLVQGRLLRQAADEVPGPSGIAAASLGLGLGAAAGNVITAALVSQYGVSLMGVILAACVLLLWVGLVAVGRLRRTPAHAA